nr:zinc finger, CCHC-type [Tanacetum cinerariifolium]
MTDSMKDMTMKFGKLDKFKGSDFRHLKKKMHFLLTTLKVVYVLSTPAPESHFCIEETLRMEESKKVKGKEIVGSSSMNMVEDDKNNKNNKNSKGNKRKLYDKNNDSNKKSKKACWKCGKPGHFKKDCRVKKNNDVSTSGSGQGSKNPSPQQGLRKNLMSGPVLNKCGYKQVYDLISEKGIDCIFIGYVEHSKPYRFYVIEPNDFISVNSVIESRDAIFDKNGFSLIPRPKDIISSYNGTQDGDLLGETSIEIPEPRRSNGAWVAKSIEEDPKTFDEAMNSQDVAFWKKAVDDEIASIMENNTWVLSDLPPGCKPLGCKWIFKKNMKVHGTIDKFKARLIIQGSRQKERINYFETYAPVARISNIRLLIALAATYNLVIHQIDVKKIFLNDDLEEEIYVKQPKGFVMPSKEHKVYKCVYCKFDESSKGVIICLYVDDMLIFGTDQNQVDKTNEFLSSNFSMKDIGEADVILGIRIKRENKGLTITQSHYIEKILKKFNCEGCGPVSTPMEACIKLVSHMGKPVNQLEYSRAIGCLMYAMTSTRPDIAYAVGKLSSFTSNPSNHHWEAIIRVFRYLKKTMNYGLYYVGFSLVIKGYSDAIWITNSEDHTSTTGWVFLLGGGAISWASKKQTCMTDSTMESEIVAFAAAGKEAEWLRNLIYEIPLWPKPISPIFIHCDSAATLAKAYSQIYNGKCGS